MASEPQYSAACPPSQPWSELRLTNGLTVLLDNEDFEWVHQYRWDSRRKTDVAKPYVVSQPIMMHRMLLGLSPGDPRRVDHKNGDTLDNRRSNLRICTSSQNGANRGPSPSNTSGFKGVTVRRTNHPKGRPFEARIQYQRKHMTLGYFSTAATAAIAYDEAALRLFGEFAWLNFPEEAS